MFTLSDCIVRINQILNYPSISYTDVSHFFDQAISELNTTFKIKLPLVKDMLDETRIDLQNIPNVHLLKTRPEGISSRIPSGTGLGDFSDETLVYFNTSDNKFYKHIQQDVWEAYSSIYGIYIDDLGTRSLYVTYAMPVAGMSIWTPIDKDVLGTLDLTIYLPEDWIVLFLIPYVCAKASVRDGGDNYTYVEEYTQGFQQLQNSYDVPNFTLLSTVAHLPAYTRIVQENISNLNIKIPVRAVYDCMKIGNSVLPQYSEAYSRGGWEF